MNNILMNSAFWLQKFIIENEIHLCFYKSEIQHPYTSVLMHSKNIGKCNAI